jgi:hypothetical protein
MIVLVMRGHLREENTMVLHPQRQRSCCLEMAKGNRVEAGPDIPWEAHASAPISPLQAITVGVCGWNDASLRARAFLCLAESADSVSCCEYEQRRISGKLLDLGKWLSRQHYLGN